MMGLARRLPDILRHPLVVFALVLLVLPFVLSAIGGSLYIATTIVTYILLAMAFNLLLGYAGLLSFGHGLFFGLAAYSAALAQIHFLTSSTLGPMLIGTLVATVTGVVVGALVLHRGGVYFALLTLAFGQIAFYLVFRATNLTGGENGLGGFGPRPVLALDLSDRVTYYFFVAVVVFLAAAVLWRVVHSPFGHVLQAIRENQERVAALGYNVYLVKIIAFTVSAGFAGLAGVLYAFLAQFTFPTLLSNIFSGEIVVMTIVGGVGSFFGPAVGAAFYVYAREILSSLTPRWLIGFGLLFIAFILFSPQGISGLVRRLAALTGLGWAAAWATGMPAFEHGDATTESGESVGSASSGAPDEAAQQQPEVPTGEHGRAFGLEDVLVAEGVVKRFGTFAAVDGVSLRLQEGTIHALIGPNGAGKTTFFNCLSGNLPLSAGHIRYRGRDTTGWPSHRIAQLGIARSFQIVSVFPNLSLFENVRLAVQAVSKSKHSLLSRAGAQRDITATARRLIQEMGLGGKEHLPAGTLSHGDQRLLDITMALATEPDLLLLDEPFAGLPSSERDKIGQVIRNLNTSRRLTVLLIEHDIERVLELSDRITVLHQGRVLADGAPAEIRANPEVQRAYLGEGHVGPVERQDLRHTEPLLKLESVDAFYGKSQALENVSLSVHPGEVVCLLGRNGAGKTTTLGTIMGTVRAAKGRIVFAGQDITNWPIERVAQAGIGIVPQGRRIFANLTVRENLLLAQHEAAAGGEMSPTWDLDRVYERFPKLKALEGRKGEHLSGGERQMLAIGRALIGNPRLLLLDEPVEGLAQAIIDEVVEIIRSLRGQVTILLVEQRAELALALADRAYVITSGQIVYDGDSEELQQQEELRMRLVGV